MASLERTGTPCPFPVPGRADAAAVRPAGRADRQSSRLVARRAGAAAASGLVPVYFWCLVRPDLMTPAAAFVIGMLRGRSVGRPARRLDPAFVVDLCPDRPPARQLRRPVGLGAVLGFAAAALVACAYCLCASSAFYYWRICRRWRRSWRELAMTVLFYIPAALVVGSAASSTGRSARGATSDAAVR